MRDLPSDEELLLKAEEYLKLVDGATELRGAALYAQISNSFSQLVIARNSMPTSVNVQMDPSIFPHKPEVKE
jgi:hypothetical protein